MRGSALPHREWKASASEDADEGLCRDVPDDDKRAPGDEQHNAMMFFFLFYDVAIECNS